MIERPQQKVPVGRPPGAVEFPGIAQTSFCQGAGCARHSIPDLFDMQGRQVEEVNAIPALGERECIHASAATHIENRRRRLRQKPAQDLERPLAFQQTDAGGEPL